MYSALSISTISTMKRAAVGTGTDNWTTGQGEKIMSRCIAYGGISLLITAATLSCKHKLNAHLRLPMTTRDQKGATTARLETCYSSQGWRRRNTVATVTGWRAGWRRSSAGEDDGEVALAAAAEAASPSPSRLTDPAICAVCRTTATATPPGDSETHCSYGACDSPSKYIIIRSENLTNLCSP